MTVVQGILTLGMDYYFLSGVAIFGICTNIFPRKTRFKQFFSLHENNFYDHFEEHEGFVSEKKKHFFGKVSE